MYALKDKVSAKLSNLFGDSPKQSSSPRFGVSNSPKARLNSSAEKALPSYFSFSSLRSRNESSELCPPLPIKHNSYDFGKNGGLGNGDQQKTYQVQTSNGEDRKTVDNGDIELGASARSNNGTGSFRDFVSHCTPVKEMPDLTDETAFISADLYEFLEASLPNIVKGCKWVLLYSTLKHGISLRTLLRRSAELPGPCLLVAGDKTGAVFGGLLEGPLRPTPKRKYQGTNQTFLFTTIYGNPCVFRPTGANRYYWMCLNEFLAFGGGGNFALWLDEDLLKGTSGSCETFGNECLASSGEFELKNVELWGFAHASRYHLSSRS
ncbi:PREDICTED: oxidation resistance protein 1 isoform X2 [Tarenaya hassleriana]|uniref:oxidation resistance protein 1 isoform X2 n=1 Tax=Tarenaya hassleriana TaxID=28532 RepID=UPI00053C4636|nr:PREDICTED: oxidation resistance protein 1 isoform X2 [Tarenaya hassleriana]